MTAATWNESAIPELNGLTYLVTGANSGIGYEAAAGLARHGAHVVLACRDLSRGRAALAAMRAGQPDASLDLVRLDLADLASVREFAAHAKAEYPMIAGLVCNAGVMGGPRRVSADGFELQLAINHLGHFALTGLLLPELLAAGRAGVPALGGPARVVVVSSGLHRQGRLRRDDLMAERSYRPMAAYARSKLANLLFVRELVHRAGLVSAPLRVLAAHPGYAATNLQVPADVPSPWWRTVPMRVLNRVAAQSAAGGAQPTLRAATDPAARTGAFYGPLRGARGAPVVVSAARQAMDDADAEWLWQRSVELTGVDYAELARPSGATS